MAAPVPAKLRTSADPELTRVQDGLASTVYPSLARLAKTPLLGAQPPPWLNVGIISTSGYAQMTTGATPFLPKTAHHTDALGYVHGKLSVVTAAGSGPAVLFEMPKGSRPLELVPFFGTDGSGASGWELGVHPDGRVEVFSTLAAGDIVVANFTYLAEQ